MSGDDRIKWLLNKDLIYQLGMRKEVFDTLKDSYKNASIEIRKLLINRIKEGIKNQEIK
jgi:hypothetical protein